MDGYESSGEHQQEREHKSSSMTPLTTKATTRLERLLSMEDALFGVKNTTLRISNVSLSSHSSHSSHSSSRHEKAMMMMLPPHSVWREKVTQWCYNVVDHLDECRSLVYVAMNILDRFTVVVSSDSNSNSTSSTSCSSSSSMIMNERCFELASMSALFLAIRIAGGTSPGGHNLQLSHLVSMTSASSGIQSKHIVAMGTRIIQRLGHDFWRVRCVTPLDFVQTLLCLSAASSSLLSTEDQQDVLNAASFLCEIAVCDAPLALAERPSHIALAALLNALDSHYHHQGDNGNSSLMIKRAMMERCIKSAIPHDSQSLMRLRLRLQAVYGQTQDGSGSNQPSGAAGVVARPHLVLDHCPQDDFSSSPPSSEKFHHSVSNDALCYDTTKNMNNKRPLDHKHEDEADHDAVVFLMATSASRKQVKRSMRKQDHLPSLIHPDE